MAATILIADDNRNIRTMLKMDLEMQGYRVLEATNGDRAYEMARKEKPDLMVLDVMMPGMSGYDVCFRMKQEADLRVIPIIMLTAKSAKEDEFLGREVGADEYMTKPFDPEALEKLISRVLESRLKGEAFHPLSGLPMWEAVKHEIARRKRRDENFLILEGNFEEETFGVYRNKYGNIKADEAVKKASELLKAATAGCGDLFVGHSGDNVFFLIGKPEEVEKAKSLMTHLMAENIPAYYDTRDRGAGFISSKQLDGRKQTLGLMKWVWKLNDVA